MSACIIPVAPDFQDPVGSPNYAPVLSDDSPPFGTVKTITDPVNGATFAFDATDPNLTDKLWVNWLADYPPYDARFTRVVQQDKGVPPNTNGTPRSFSVNLSCMANSVIPNTTNLHQLQVIVSDRAFKDGSLDEAESPGLITKDNWTFYLPCSNSTGSP